MAKTVVITGSTRGLGNEMAKCFRRENWNVMLNGVNPERLRTAAETLAQTAGSGRVECFRASVASPEEIRALAEYAVGKFGSIDIWINNAGVNQPMKALWELTDKEIDSVLDIDLRGTIIGSCTAAKIMEQQPEGGYIYNIEGYGSNDAMMPGLNLYGTGKRAVTHFTVALAKELAARGSKVRAGRLSPGIMITDFISSALGGEQRIELPDKTKKVYNILGDRPETVAAFLVERMLTDPANNARINWLTGRKAAWRFLTAAFSRRDFFAGEHPD